MRVVLIDDQSDCLEILFILISKYCPNLHIVGQFDDPKVAVIEIEKLKPDLVFLDVQMPDLTGFDVLERCKTIPFQIIFTSAYEQYALKAFKYSAIDYLLKPVDKTELVAAVQKIRHFNRINFQTQQRDILLDYVNPVKSLKEKIALPTSDGIDFINIQEIVYCESEGNYTKIFLSQSKASIYTKSLKDIEELLQAGLFYRIHHSYLINLKHVKQYIKSDGGSIKMSNGNLLPISRQKKDEILEILSHL